MQADRTSPSGRRLIFNADDYGLTPSVSAGILAASAGVVRSTSVLANFVTAPEAAALAASRLSVGAHLNLSSGAPLSADYPPELLLPDGRFDKQRALDPATWASAAYRDAALKEWWAQLDLLEQLGVALDHLDSHHHTHLLEPLFQPALDLALARRLALRVRTPQFGLAWAAGVLSPETLHEGYFGAGNLTREALLAALAQAPGRSVEVMCHPGLSDPLLEAVSSYTVEREEELKVLGDPDLAEALSELGWQISDYRL